MINSNKFQSENNKKKINIFTNEATTSPRACLSQSWVASQPWPPWWEPCPHCSTLSSWPGSASTTPASWASLWRPPASPSAWPRSGPRALPSLSLLNLSQRPPATSPWSSCSQVHRQQDSDWLNITTLQGSSPAGSDCGWRTSRSSRYSRRRWRRTTEGLCVESRVDCRV